jgi:hypothetical protein
MDALISPDRTRREGVEAFSITLADGNRWGLALPSPRLRPVVVEGVDSLGRPTNSIDLVSEYGYPLEIRRLIDDLRSACDQGVAERQYECLIRLAAALIRRAHDIDLAVAASLLELGVDELPGVVEAILWVVTGQCPVDPASPRKSEVDG